MRQKIGMVIVAVMVLVLAGALGYVVAKEDGRFNATSAGCTCHTNGPSAMVLVSITGLPILYTPGMTYTVTVTVTGGPPPNPDAQGGFNLLVSHGTLVVPPGAIDVRVNGPAKQATHDTPGNDQRSWDVWWIAPPPGDGIVTFTAVAISVDGDGLDDEDDLWNKVIVQSDEGVAPPIPTADLIYPDGGEDLTGDSTHDILFLLNDPDNTPDELLVWINYSLDGGGAWSPTGAQGIPGTIDVPNIYQWVLPLVDSTQSRVKVDVVDPAGQFGTDQSAADFEIDSTPPVVLSESPVGIDVVITTNIQVNFSEPMDQASAVSAFSLKDTVAWTTVTGTFSWIVNSMIFDPDALLQPGTEYTANVTMFAKDDSDSGNNFAILHNWTFTTMSGADLEPPTISDVTAVPSPLEVGGNVNISAIIQDNVGVDHAWVNVTLPGGGFLEDPMDHDVANDRYYVNRSYPELGTYDFTVWAEDTNGLQNSSVGQFDIVDTTPPVIAHVPVSLALANDTINITATVMDNFGLAAVNPVRLEYVNVTGTFNITMPSVGGDDYQGQIPAQLVAGDVTYFVWASDSTGNEIRTSWYTITVVTQDIFPPEILGVQAMPSPQERYGDVNITATVRDLSGLLSVWVVVTHSGTEIYNTTMTEGLNDLYYMEDHYDIVGTHDFTIWAEDNGGMGNSSSGHSFDIVDTTPPAAPTGLSVASGDAGTLDITWTANTELDLDGYDLYRSDTGANLTFTKVNTALITGTTYTDTGLEDNTTYYYMLKAVDDEGLESEFSHPASGTTIIPGAEEEVDYMWLYALIAILVILVVVLAAASAARKKPSEEEEEELEELDEVGEEYTSEEKGEEIAEEEIAETSEDEPLEPM